MKKRFNYRWIVLLIPFLLGVYGYSLLYGENWLGAIYSSLRLYGLNVDVPEADINIYLQIARWLAIVVTTSIVIMLFKRTIEEIALHKRLRNPNIVIVHGDGSRKDAIIAAIGNQAISMSGKSCFEAKQHILAFESDEAALQYLQDNEKQLLDKQDKVIYFSSYDYEPSDYAQSGLVISNNAVNCAREYWRKCWVRDNSVKK